MKSVKKIIKITIILTFIAFFGRFTYIELILKSPFRNELERCLENSRHMKDPLMAEIAENVCFEVYPY